MLICSNCGSTSPDGTKFCPNCGASLGTQKRAGCFSGCAVVVVIFVMVIVMLAMCSPKESEPKPVQTTIAVETPHTTNRQTSETKTNSVRPQKNGFDNKTNKTVVIGSYQIKVPAYLKNGTYNNSKKTFVAEVESGEQTVIFLFGFKPGLYTYDSLCANKETMINNLKDINLVLGTETGDALYSDYNSKLGKGLMLEHLSTETINGVSVHMYNRYVFIPVKDGVLVFVLGQSSQSKWIYTNDLEKIINSVEIKKPTKKSKTKKKSTKKSTGKKSSKKTTKKRK